MATRNQVPRANGEGSIGTSVKKWLAGWFGTVNATTVSTGSVVATGNVGAATFTGDGSALTGIASGTGGVINTGSTTIGADSDDNGSGEIALQTRGATKMTVANAGNVGIGTITPEHKLNLYGSGGTAAGGGLLGIDITDNGSVSWASETINSNLTTGQNVVHFIGKQSNTKNTAYFGFNYEGDGSNDNYATIGLYGADNILNVKASGKVGIGTTTPAYQLQLSTDSAAKPSTNTWTVASDERLKENIIFADIDRCYEIVKILPLKRYTWKDEVYAPEQVADRSKLGWIAQDVEQVFSKAVGTHRFAYNQVYETITEPVLDEQGDVILTADGTPKQISRQNLVGEDVIEDCRSLNSDQIIAAMYGTIQKLQQKVEALEAELTGHITA